MNMYNSNANRMFNYVPTVKGYTWQAVGNGIFSIDYYPLFTISVYNSNVYAGGDFINVGGDTNKKYIARWDGATWRALSTGTNTTVLAIYAKDNSNVYVGGRFTLAGGKGVTYIARWDGTTWQAMGTGLNSFAFAISAYDNSNIYVGGDFDSLGGDTNKSYIAKWTNVY